MSDIPQPLRAYALDFARRFGAILAGLAALVARRLLRAPRFAALVVPLWTRLTRTARRCERLLAALAAGRRPRSRRPECDGPGKRSAALRGTAAPLPAGRLWLIRVLGPEAAVYASQLEALLAEPPAAALLARAPAVQRLLRPIGRLLGLPGFAASRCPSPRGLGAPPLSLPDLLPEARPARRLLPL